MKNKLYAIAQRADAPRIAQKGSGWRLQKRDGNHVTFWKFDNTSNRRLTAAVPIDRLEAIVTERVTAAINLSQLEARIFE